ncbi:MAG: SAM-dependent methyltransferase, partial [Pseudomonadota bacterium]|nr:SAM-dependent methyltransferase [Pseudomonadota bacterium]
MKKIKKNGPLNLAEYMDISLNHPQYGYYQEDNIIGREGDFVTSPEISQMFGELLGVWAAASWHKLGRPDKINLIEMGPGRGTLMRDALRAINTVPDFRDAINVHLVEKSSPLRAIQMEELSQESCQVCWHENFEDVPHGDFILVANEFLDALPIHQFIKYGEHWAERLVGIDIDGTSLVWTLSS